MLQTIEIYFDKGTLILKNVSEAALKHLSGIKWDQRTRTPRAPAYFYRNIVLTLRKHQITYSDHARQFNPMDFTSHQL